jgi:hypothetical protein
MNRGWFQTLAMIGSIIANDVMKESLQSSRSDDQTVLAHDRCVRQIPRLVGQFANHRGVAGL